MAELTNGLDVSHYQGAVSWTNVAQAGFHFAFIKATEGLSHLDASFASNWKQAHAAGVLRGAYHFFRPKLNAQKQAELFAQVVKLQAGDLPPVLDFEAADGIGKAGLIKGAKTWLQTVEQLTGQKPIIYTGPAFWNEHMSNEFGAYPLWIAHYTSASSPHLPAGWAHWTFWQYSDHGTVAGVQGPCDVNRFHGSPVELLAFAGAAQPGDSAPAPAPPPPASAGKTYVVRPGDTLGAIARRKAVTVAALAHLNHLDNPNLIHVGQVLRLPA